MAASKKDVDFWIEEAKRRGATHIISVCDTFDYSDYPVYVMPGENVSMIKDKYASENMQRVNEVIKIENATKNKTGRKSK